MTAQAPPPPASVQPQTPGEGSDGLLRLLQLEADIRRIRSERELIHHLANESRSVLGFRQAFVFRYRHRRWRLRAISSVSSFNTEAPLNRQLLKFIGQHISNDDGDKPRRVDLPVADRPEQSSEFSALQQHNFRHGLWLALRDPTLQDRREPFAAVLLLHERPWPDSILPLAERMAETYAHAWRALLGKRLYSGSGISVRRLGIVVALLLGLAGFIRAPLTVLAPVEVVGQERVAIAAPITGVIDEVLVQPNAAIEQGMTLARFADTELRNALAIAEQQVTVARARLEQLQSASFTERSAARELKVAEAELKLAEAERALARERLAQSVLSAPRAGVAIFDDARELTGRPVSVGQRIMEIADPGRLEFSIRLPVADSIVLSDTARVRIFLDSDPLQPLDGALVRSSYHANSQADGSFGYTLVARVDQPPATTRIGAQGTAQIFGQRHSLFFHAFRRPLSWLRQNLGV